MDSRLNKYSDNKNMSRVTRNMDLYKEINNTSLENYSIKSNATIIGNQEPEIDIEKIKKILDTKYNEAPKRRSIRIEPKSEETKLIDDTPTKEYDLNVILEKAKDEKEETYEEARAKKLRNTQFDILNNLNIEEKKEEVSTKAEDDLMELINTITIKKEKKNKTEDDPLDILNDLKGEEGTEVYDSMTEMIAESNENLDKAKKQIEEKKEPIDDSFYTTNLFKKKDFEDSDDEFVDNDKLNIGIKILIALVITCFIIGLILFLKSFLNF